MLKILVLSILFSIGCSSEKQKLAWPIEDGNGIITSHIGPRWGKMHTGVDIGAKRGVSVLAAGDGIVTGVLYDRIFGNRVIIYHQDIGVSTSYSHLNEVLVSEGDRISRRDKIGTVGTTGKSTGPHLHFELHSGNVFFNPEIFMVAHSYPLKLPFPK